MKIRYFKDGKIVATFPKPGTGWKYEVVKPLGSRMTNMVEGVKNLDKN